MKYGFATEPSKSVPVIDEADVLIIGGSPTAVCAALRAARRGLKVVIIERSNMIGGTCTNALVCHWPSGLDANYEERIIGGISFEIIERLQKRGLVTQDSSSTRPYSFVPTEMVVELENLLTENGVAFHLHTLGCSPWVENDQLKGIFIENKNGRSAIRSQIVVDCSGDGDILAQLDVPAYFGKELQPPSLCFLLHGMDDVEKRIDWIELVKQKGMEYGIEPDWGWNFPMPGRFNIRVMAEFHVFGGNLCIAEDLTAAEVAGRKKARAFFDLIRSHMPIDEQPLLSIFPALIGIRQTRQFKAIKQVRGKDLLAGNIPEDYIGRSSNRVDIHNSKNGAITFRYLNGEEHYIEGRGIPSKKTRWRNDNKEVLYYGIPFSCTIPQSKYPNLLMAGRMFDADTEAFGALRLQMYLNELGEAVGEASSLMLRHNIAAKDVNVAELRELLVDGGSLL
ncbi:MAG: FAD-dependent oxidoreductase [Victivallales bacterium]|nr:FAD-dependent oxidoreductase [Victivallales bacterium]